MKYELTQDLVTGNALIDSEHRQLFAAVNSLMDACAEGKGRGQIQQTAQFLSDYVVKHFGDEERLQVQSSYPGYSAHKQFHDGYRRQLADVMQELVQKDSGKTPCPKHGLGVSSESGWKMPGPAGRPPGPKGSG